MNKKGFTLVEILAVIVILAIVMTIAVPGIMTISQRMKNRSLDAKLNLIEKAAVTYAQDKSNAIKASCKNNSINCVLENDTEHEAGVTTKVYHIQMTLEELVATGYYKAENADGNDGTKVCNVTNPADNDGCLDCSIVHIYLSENYKTATSEVKVPDNQTVSCS